MLIAFASLIIRNRMYTKLKDSEEEMAERPNYMNVPDSIRELEKIKMIRQADGVYWLDHAVTATQKAILNAFGIDANYIKKKGERYQRQPESACTQGQDMREEMKMPRGRRKVTTTSLDDKIEQQKKVLEKAKVK